MLSRLGIVSRSDLIVFLSILALVGVTPLGSEATHPVVMAVYRTLLLGLLVHYVIKMKESSPTRLSRYFVGSVVAVAAAMLASMALRPGSHFEGMYAFYEKTLFFLSLIALAH